MQNDILFDNIYIGHSVADAQKLMEETFVPKVAAEKAEEEANAPKPADAPKVDLVFKDDPVLYIREKLNLFIDIAKRNPVEAIKTVPEVATGLGALAVALIAILASALGGGAVAAAPSKEQLKAQAKKAKDVAVDAKDKAAEAVATGAEKAQAELNKRTTRSNASS
jgi:calnexin